MNQLQTKTQINRNLIIEQLKKTPIVQIACEKVGIARSTFYRWKKQNRKFAIESEQAMKTGINLINDMAESQLLAAIRDQNMTAIIFWLKHHHSAYGTKITLDATVTTELSEEQKELIKKSLQIANLIKGKKHEKNNK